MYAEYDDSVNEYLMMDSIVDYQKSDKYVGNSYARRKVIRWKRDADGNAVGTKNENPIHDTRKYCVEFDDGEVS